MWANTDLQSAQGLIQRNRSDGADDDRFSVASQGVLQNAGQFTVSVVGEASGRRPPRRNTRTPAISTFNYKQPAENLQES